MERLFYDTSSSHPPKIRSVPMRVLALGISRSGTESLSKALVHLGIKNSIHGYSIGGTPGALQKWLLLGRKKYHASSPAEAKVLRHEFDEITGDSEAITDFTAAVHAADLVDAYPEAKVILNVRRDLDAWYNSMSRTFTVSRRGIDFGFLCSFNAELYWRRAWFNEVFDQFWHNDFDATAVWRYEEHVNMVRGLVPKERLLEWSVEDGWEPLCQFLDLEVPKNVEFPNGNMPKDFFAKIDLYRRAQRRAAWRNIFLSISCAAIACTWAVRSWLSD